MIKHKSQIDARFYSFREKKGRKLPVTFESKVIFGWIGRVEV